MATPSTGLWELIDKYLNGFKEKFDPYIFADEYINYGPMRGTLKGGRNKQEFLKEMEAFSKNMPLDVSKGERGITMISKSYDSHKNLAIVFYVMHFKNSIDLDVVDVFTIQNNKIYEITGVFDSRMFI